MILNLQQPALSLHHHPHQENSQASTIEFHNIHGCPLQAQPRLPYNQYRPLKPHSLTGIFQLLLHGHHFELNLAVLRDLYGEIKRYHRQIFWLQRQTK